MKQPFDKYKDIKYDYIIQADVKIEKFSKFFDLKTYIIIVKQ